jgi:putative OPT family oligopeptide transporter
MENSNNQLPGLPENAYRELNKGEEYFPIMPASMSFPEITPWSVIWGVVMAIIFTAAVAYSSLKIGQAMEAAIPISIIAVGVASAFKKQKTLGQNVIIQSIGASSGVIVAGAAFTIPSLYILKLDVSFYQIFFASLLGGFLGILFMIPFRKYFVKEMHGKFPFPEATATTEILVTGEKGGKQALTLVVSGLIGGVYDFLFNSLHLWGEQVTSKIIPVGEKLAQDMKLIFKMNVSSLVFSFGYLIGLKYSLIIVLGSLFSWFVFIPFINQLGVMIALPGQAGFFSAMSPEAIFSQFVRPVGIGAIAMAGMIGIIKSWRVIGSAFSLAFSGLFGKKSEHAIAEARTQTDVKMSFVLQMILVTLIGAFLFVYFGVHVTLMQAIVSVAIIFIISFLFTTVAANAIAIVGSNPVSGMTLMTLILASIILVNVDLKGNDGVVAAMLIGGIVCTALSMAGGFVTDLKVGYWLGSSPIKQERFKFLGVIVSAATVGFVIFILNDAYGFKKTVTMTQPQYESFTAAFVKSKPALDSIAIAKDASTMVIDERDIAQHQYTIEKPAYDSLMKISQSPLSAPQANAMAAVIDGLMNSDKPIPWGLYLVGAMMALFMNWLGIAPLAFALGMYLPQDLNTPLLVGGLLAYFINKSSKDEKLVNARTQRGTLIASGFMAGAAIFGVIGALMIFFNLLDRDMNKAWFESIGGEWVALAMFALLIVYFVWESMRAKIDE